MFADGDARIVQWPVTDCAVLVVLDQVAQRLAQPEYRGSIERRRWRRRGVQGLVDLLAADSVRRNRCQQRLWE